MKIVNEALGVIMKEEGFRERAYLCSEGYLTIGYGTKISNRKGLDPKDFCLVVTKMQARSMLLSKVQKLIRVFSRSYMYYTFTELPERKQIVIISMMYQLGVHGLGNFRRMWSALESRNWSKAKYEALDSLWAKQTPQRAMRHAKVLGE